MRYITLIVLTVSVGCAGLFHPDTTSPRAVARRECDDWLQRHNLMQRPRAGTNAYHQLVKLCTEKHLASAGAEIDNALAALEAK